MAKILFYDIENTANVVRTWGGRMYDLQAIKVVKPWELLSVGYKWLGEKEVHCLTRQNQKSDKQLLGKFINLLNQADIVVAHNAVKFDNKQIATRLVKHDIDPPRPFKTIDTRIVAKSKFNFNSNKLDDLGEFLGLGRKIKHGEGFELWERCEANERAAWETMVRYNKQDVVLLERIYLKLRPWMSAHPNTAERGISACPKCASKHLVSNGFRTDMAGVYRRYQCQACGGWAREREGIKGEKKFRIVNG